MKRIADHIVAFARSQYVSYWEFFVTLALCSAFAFRAGQIHQRREMARTALPSTQWTRCIRLRVEDSTGVLLSNVACPAQ